MSVSLPYSEELINAIHIAKSIAKEYLQDRFTPAHILKAMLHKDSSLVEWLNLMGKDIKYLREWADVRIETSPKSSGVIEEVVGNEQIPLLLEEADIIRIKLSKNEIDLICVLAATCKPNLAFTSDQLKTFPISQKEIIDEVLETNTLHQAVGPDEITAKKSKKKSPKINALHKFCIDKTALAAEGKIDPIIGRDKETRMMIEILGRRTKPNVLILGEPGVGKTALVDGFALNIIEKSVPQYLDAALLFELDLGSLIAGASYKGEIEDRLKNIIKELKEFDKAILFVDEIHTLLDTNGPIGSGANLLKPEMARGEITLIGATTLDEYREFIESEEAFNRRFEVLKVEEPDIKTASRMVKKLLPFYEEHHQIKAVEAVSLEAVLLAKRYIKDRRLPDAALDLMDRTMSAIRIMEETSGSTIVKLREELEVLKGHHEPLLFNELEWFHLQLKEKISPILYSQLVEEENEINFDSSDRLLTYLNSKLSKLEKLVGKKKNEVDITDLAAIVSYKTGIPLGKIQTKERERLLGIEEKLKERVVGQDGAIKALSEAILESRSGLIKAGQPIGSFFLLGPTGTGKTELSKALAEFLFNDENALIRFDMSEFKEEHSAALLYGAPPGYVGYKEGGLLVNKIRQNPYAVLLFDEIEKAHNSVFDVFLQILDEGKLHDRLGKEGDFSNAVILFTSNIGSDHIIEKFGDGKMPDSNEMLEIMSDHFRPEFLARITEIVPFAPIAKENVVKIFEIHLQKLKEILEKQGITLILSDAAKEYLATSGFTQKYGARPLKSVIRNKLRRPLSKMIITGQIANGSLVELDIDSKNKLNWKFSIATKNELVN